MDRLFKKKSKKPPKYSQRGHSISLGIPTITNVAAGPLVPQPQLDTAPKGEKICSYRDLDLDWTDSAVAPDEESGGGSQIAFQGKAGKDQELPAQETSTPGVVDVGDTDHEHRPSSECPRSSLTGLTFMWIQMPSRTRGGHC